MSHDGSTLADTTWYHPAVTRSDYRRPAQPGEWCRWAQLRADRPRITVVGARFRFVRSSDEPHQRTTIPVDPASLLAASLGV